MGEETGSTFSIYRVRIGSASGLEAGMESTDGFRYHRAKMNMHLLLTADLTVSGDHLFLARCVC